MKITWIIRLSVVPPPPPEQAENFVPAICRSRHKRYRQMKCFPMESSVLSHVKQTAGHTTSCINKTEEKLSWCVGRQGVENLLCGTKRQSSAVPWNLPRLIVWIHIRHLQREYWVPSESSRFWTLANKQVLVERLIFTPLCLCKTKGSGTTVCSCAFPNHKKVLDLPICTGLASQNNEQIITNMAGITETAKQDYLEGTA